VYAPGRAAGLVDLVDRHAQATGCCCTGWTRRATAYDAAFYIMAAGLFLRSYAGRRPLLRQQLKWVTRGTLLAVLPFTLLYAVPFLLDCIRRDC
jgi:two-component system NtrC family sensor kinase